jgi:hypothetical protein
MSRLFAIGLTSAFITRIQEQVFDPQLIATLQERLAAHGAELQGQLPELLLRSNSPEEAIRSWLSDKDLSHWVPQAQGGSAAQGWQFETASWNRSRGAEPMTPLEVGRAHVDGGFDAIQAPGVAADLAGHCLEAAVIAAVITLGWELTRNRSAWLEATPSARRDRLIKTLRSVGLASISGASLSLAVSLAIALIPGAQIWLMAGAICSAARALPGQRDQAFDLRSWIST